MNIFSRGSIASLMIATALIAFALPVLAEDVVFHPSNTSLQSYLRPTENCTASNISAQYQVWEFQVSTNGAYKILSNQTFDGFIALYKSSFSAASPTVNCIAGNDDASGGSLLSSEIKLVALQANTYYYLVTSGIDTNNKGAFDTTIIGPGKIELTVTKNTGTTTVNSPKFVRPNADCGWLSQNFVSYEKLSFVPVVSGNYSIHAYFALGYDGFLHIYENAFDYTAPLVNCMLGNDDYGTQASSKIQYVALSSGKNYEIVVSGYDSTEVGSYINRVLLTSKLDNIFADDFEDPLAKN